MTNGRLDRLAYRTIESSQRSLVSDAESDVGSLLSGLSQARQIPNRRSKDENKGRSKPKPANERSPRKREKPTAGPPTSPKNNRNNEKYKHEIKTIIKIQAVARGYIQRFAYQSQLTMEKTKKKFFAIQIQAFVRGCLQRKRFHEEHGKKRLSRGVRKESSTNRDLSPLSLGSPKPIKKSRKPKHVKAKPIPHLELESDSERSEISSRLERLTKGRRDRVKSRELLDEKLGESESEVGSIISNLSQARRVPDRRRKREDQEKKAIKIQALARGYIQRFLFRSVLALENTRKKYAAMTIQARSRGYLQRKNGPQVSRSHVAPRREPLPETKVTSSALMDQSSGSSKRRRRRRHKVSRRDGRRDVRKKMKKPRRRRSDSEDSDVVPPRELTIRKPIRHRSNSDNESDVPQRQARHSVLFQPQEAIKTDSHPARKEKVNGELTDEELRKLLKPDPAVDELMQLVKRNFAPSEKDSVEVLKDLDSYDDRNFWIKIGGVDHLVKIHNGVESLDLCRAIDQRNKDSVIHFQYKVMKILADSGITASQPVLSHEATQSKSEIPLITELPVVSAAHSPCKLAVSVFSWVPGKTMAEFKMLPVECLADAGSFLGKLHQKLDMISLDKFPAARRYHQWDGKNTADLKDFLHCIKDESRRSMISSILKAFESDLIESGVASTFRKSVNHADFNDANILLDDNFRVSGVIDFGDSVESWTVLDVSVAMAYSMLSAYGKRGRSLSAAAAMLRGFHLKNPLTKTEREHLVLLVACRLACSVTLGAYSCQQNPENKYLLLHAEPAWKALEFIWDTDPLKRKKLEQAMNHLFDMACKSAKVDENGVIDCVDISIPDAFILDWLESMNVHGHHKSKKG